MTSCSAVRCLCATRNYVPVGVVPGSCPASRPSTLIVARLLSKNWTKHMHYKASVTETWRSLRVLLLAFVLKECVRYKTCVWKWLYAVRPVEA